MIDYSPLWNTLKSKGINQYRLIRSYHFSSGQLHRIRKNEHVSTHTLETLCRILNCSVADIVRISFDRVEKNRKNIWSLSELFSGKDQCQFASFSFFSSSKETSITSSIRQSRIRQSVSNVCVETYVFFFRRLIWPELKPNSLINRY